MTDTQGSPPIYWGRYATAILAGLQDRHVYGGTASPFKVARRRAKNKAARRSRRINRRSR